MEAAAQQHKETPRSLTIERGKKAWGYITNTERQNKQHWLDVGKALLVGRAMFSRKQDKEFGAWCAEHFLGLSRGQRADAMWAAEHEEVYTACTRMNPTHARQQHREDMRKELKASGGAYEANDSHFEEESEDADRSIPLFPPDSWESDTCYPVSTRQDFPESWSV
jgi:hypothetical protein